MQNFRNALQNLAAWALILFVFLLPLKFGLMLLPGVANGYPAELIAWAVNGWPPSLFVILSGILLAISLLGYGVPQSLNFRRGNGLVLTLWLLATPVALIGWLDASSWENPVVETQYLLGVAAFAGAVHINLAARGKALAQVLLNSAVVGILLTVAVGIHQVIWGFDDMCKFVEMQEKVYHIEFPADFKARVFDRRAYATFTFASGLAGALALTGLAAVATLYRWGNRFEPVKLSRRLFALLGAIAILFVFFATKGRGAFLAVIAAAALIGTLMLPNRKLKITILAAALLAVVGGAWYIQHAGRGFGSMTERVGYLRTTAISFTRHPLVGDGWGDFTNAHARLKCFGNEEMARDPHNMAAAFADACGVLGLLWSALLFVVPWLLGYRKLRREKNFANAALLFGLTAFELHALMDLDWQVPGLMGLWIVMQAILIQEDNAEKVSGKRICGTAILSLAALAAIAAGWLMAWGDVRFNAFSEAAGQMPGQAVGQGRLARKVRQLGNAALEVMPYSHSIYLALGRYALQRGDAAQAITDFCAALARAPEYQPIYRALADAYAANGDVAKAEEFDREADARFPHYVEFMKTHPEKRPKHSRRSFE